MRARLVGVTKSHGAQVVLEDASLEVARTPASGSSAERRRQVDGAAAARWRGGTRPWIRRHRSAKDDGRPSAAGGRARLGETLRRAPRAADGVPTAERALEHAAAALAGSARDNACGESPQALSDRYDAALSRSRSAAGTSTPARPRPARGSGCASTSTGRSRASRAAKPRACRSPRCCSPARTSAARRADERPRRAGARAARGVRRGLPGRSCSSRTTGRSSTGRCDASPRSIRARTRSSSGPAAGRTSSGAVTRPAPRRTVSSPTHRHASASSPRLLAATHAGAFARGWAGRPHGRRRPTRDHALSTKVRQAERLPSETRFPRSPSSPGSSSSSFARRAVSRHSSSGSRVPWSSRGRSVSARSSSSSTPESDLR